MARPRTPSNVLELKGAFTKNPNRRRQDAEGAGPFTGEPPGHLPGAALPAWRYIVSRLPRVALSSSDEIAVEMAARILAAIWNLGDGAPLTSEFARLNEALSKWLAKLGMTPADRAKLPSAAPAGGNRFERLRPDTEGDK